MKLFAVRLALAFYLMQWSMSADTLRGRVRRFMANHFSVWLWQWDTFHERILEMYKRIQIKSFLLVLGFVWLYAVLFVYQHAGILAGIYVFAVVASPAFVVVWLATHKPKSTEG